MADCIVTEIQRYSLQDGPGIRTTIFLKGCPLHCPWCHNPETQSPQKELYYNEDKCTKCGKCVEVCRAGASLIQSIEDGQLLVRLDRDKCISCMKCVEVCMSRARSVIGKELSIDTIVKYAVADKMFFKNSGGGVTISGGDPLLYINVTLELVIRLKSEGVHIALETSCFQRFEIFKCLIDYVDLFIVDIKTMNKDRHREAVGVSLDIVLSNIENLLRSKANVRIHLPIIPEFNDSMEDFAAYINYLEKLADQLDGVDVLPFHCFGENKYSLLGRRDGYAYRDVKDMSHEKLHPLVRGLKRAGIKDVTIGGLVGVGT